MGANAIYEISTLSLQIVATILTLIFTAYSIFLGLKLNNNNLNLEKLNNIEKFSSLTGKTEEQIRRIFEDDIIKPFTDYLDEIHKGFIDTIFALVIICIFSFVIFIVSSLSSSGDLFFISDYSSTINIVILGFIIGSFLYSLLSIYSSAKLFFNLRKISK